VARHYVYILLCADGTLYTGYTTEPARRLGEHNSGKGSKYTRSRLPVRLVHLEELSSRGEALRREVRIKRMSRKEKRSLSRNA
jgi:putative endonuclease